MDVWAEGQRLPARATGAPCRVAYDGYTGRALIERRLQWQGTRDLASYLAVPAAIEFQRRNNWHAVRDRCHLMAIEALHQIVRRSGLAPLGNDADHAQMVALPVPPQDSEALRKRLFEAHGIEVPVTQHARRTFVRLSVQGYNTAEDVERLCAAL
jgi:isopenicillin-N epimerase